MSVATEEDGSQQFTLFIHVPKINIRQSLFRILRDMSVDDIVKLPRELCAKPDSLNLAVNVYRRDNPRKGITLKKVSPRGYKLWRWK